MDRLRSIGVLLVAVMGNACVLNDVGGQGSAPPATVIGPTEPAQPNTTRGVLGTPRTFKVKAGGSADVTARRTLGPDLEESAGLPILDGALVVHVRDDGRLIVDSLELSLGDIHLSAATVPPAGLDLMGVKLRLANEMPSEVRWSENDTAAVASGNVRLLLDWSLKGQGGQVVPLATLRIEPVPIELDIQRTVDGDLTAMLHAEREGVFWAWTGYLELADLRLDLEAAQ